MCLSLKQILDYHTFVKKKTNPKMYLVYVTQLQQKTRLLL